MDTKNKSEVLGLDFADTIWREANSFAGGVYDPFAVGFFDKDALPAVLQLSRERFNTNIWVVSKVRESDEEFVRDELERVHFWQQLGIAVPQIRFCREHADKAIICRELGVTHFVDDRPAVLVAMEGVVPVRIKLTLSGLSSKSLAVDCRGIYHAESWAHILRMLLPAPQ